MHCTLKGMTLELQFWFIVRASAFIRFFLFILKLVCVNLVLNYVIRIDHFFLWEFFVEYRYKLNGSQQLTNTLTFTLSNVSAPLKQRWNVYFDFWQYAIWFVFREWPKPIVSEFKTNFDASQKILFINWNDSSFYA